MKRGIVHCGILEAVFPHFPIPVWRTSEQTSPAWRVAGFLSRSTPPALENGIAMDRMEAPAIVDSPIQLVRGRVCLLDGPLAAPSGLATWNCSAHSRHCRMATGGLVRRRWTPLRVAPHGSPHSPPSEMLRDSRGAWMETSDPGSQPAAILATKLYLRGRTLCLCRHRLESVWAPMRTSATTRSPSCSGRVAGSGIMPMT